MAIQTRTRRVLTFTAGMVVAWTLTALIAGQLAQPDDARLAALGPGAFVPSDAWTSRVARAIVAGVSSGLVASFLELRVLPRYALRIGVGAMLALRTFAYSAVGLIAVFTTIRFMARTEFGIPVSELFTSVGFQAFLRGPPFLMVLLTFVVASFIINSGLQVARLLGPGAVTQILLGRYLRPTEEDRSFLFVDLADSTGIAERLGALRFAEFKNDFFHDIAEPVLNTRGQIVQYVGDEVLITWPARTRSGRTHGDSVRCFFSIRQRVRERAEDYQERYGLVPHFRAGLHSGPVVVSQLGDIKREIAFSGDVVNTASRIQGLCRVLERDFLASRDVIESLDLPDTVESEELGEHSLRGRATPVSLIALGSTVG